MPESVQSKIKRYPVATFFALTFAFSWGYTGLLFGLAGTDLGILQIPFAWGPLLGGLLTVWLLGESVSGWLGQVGRWRVGIHWYLIGIAVLVVGKEMPNLVAWGLGADVSVVAGTKVPAVGYFISMGIILFVAGALEEFGWRGFAQVRLQQRYSAVTASVVVGLVWVLWHLPYLLAGVGGFAPLYVYLPEVVAFSLVLGWLYNATDGALPVVMVTHTVHNRPDLLGASGEMPVLAESVAWDAVFYVLVIAIVAWEVGARTLSGDGTLPVVPGTAGASSTVSETPPASQ
jgi:membrane protease YdiL (CAAX protease family)